ncbi:Transposon Tf2-9 polyprotein [Araneus ventricosus]|uniref:RNA-directed DNA polymerase n=1 Tax=Araneus ventricosus TaxID=182803 RepID=A0A4Y2CYN1_ARAVE|nr:Transposon Tf2-9 polyprotein [Araneus ventricosus]GBM08838.1 Transposon Tf2-9 polyprotein [Araneus ventricosus]
MAFLLARRKEDLMTLAADLDLTFEASFTKLKLKELIIKSPDYVEDDVKKMLDGIVEERTKGEEKAEKEKIRKEKKEEREYELEKLRIQAQRIANIPNSAENVQTPNKPIHETFHKFNMQEDISLNLTLFERHAELTFLPKKDWVQKLIGLIPIEIAHLIAREPADKCNDYDHTYFDGWTSGLKVNTYDQLRELIIADQMKEKAPYDLREHFLDEWSTINSPIELAKKFEDYEDVRRTIKPKQFKSFAKGSSNNHKYFRGQEHFHLGNNGNEKKYFQPKITVYDKRIKQLTCSYCKGPGHYAVDCTKRRKDSKNNKSSSSPVQICSRISKERIKTRKITIGNKTFEALIDTGSSVTLIREDVSKGIIEQSKLTRDIVVLSGLGKYEVKTKGSFQREIELDGEKYSVTWHVVPTPYLEFQAVIGSDILEQAFVGFDRKGVYFRKHEDKVWFMHTQVYEARIEDEIEVKHVTNPRIRKELSKLINNYIPKKTETTNVSMRIILKDDVPVYQPARRLSFPENQAVNKQIDEWLDQGIVRQSSSEYASPIVLVKKKDGTARLCIDYRKLNRKLVKDRFPLPLIEDVLDKLQDAKVYSTLDLKNGFFHVEVNEDCKHFTSFVVPDGQFEFNKVPFGLSTSPSVFQRYVYSIFRELMRKGIVIIYMDDLIIPAKDEDEGIEKLKKVFEVASKYGLEIKFKKCQFLRRKVEFLGHVVENGTVRPSVAKTIAVKKFPVPTTVKQVQSFLGLTGYFRKFIPAYSKIAKPLSDLIRSDNPFVFEQPQIEAFEKLKKLLTESPVLSIFQQGKTTELHTDASQQGYGAVLLQEAEDGKLHPVQYMSKKTTPAEEKYSSYELEVLAVVNALRKFRTYLMGNHFKIITDCSAFQRTMDKKDLVTRIARWALLLEEFDYEIVHRSGQRMQHVDALSRYPVAIITSDTLTARLKRAQQEDEYTQSLRSMIGSNSDSDFFDKNEILYKYVDGRELIVVPRDMQTEIIKLAHEKGHFSAAKTEGVVKQEFFIPNLSKQVQNVIVNCVPCILTNKKSGKKDGFLNPIPKEDVPLKDALDKLKVQQKTFGNPKRIITDRGFAFTSKAFGDYCTNENIQHFQITTGVPRGNGQVERIHRTLIPVLTKLSIADSTKWFKFVDPLQRILNSTFNRSTKWSPFELLIGVTMRNKEDLHLRDLLMEEMMEELQEQRDELRQDAKKNIQKIQAENKRTYDRKCRNAPSYQRGDLVVIQRTQFGTGLKLRPRFLGPYRIVKVKPRNRYDLEKVGNHDGPKLTNSSADLMKFYSPG